MFTGIIEAQAQVISFNGLALTLTRPSLCTDSRKGHSISVSGVCLTVSSLTEDSLGFDVSHETLKVSTLGNLKAGDSVHLERSLKVGDRLNGHIVQGHCEGVGTLMATSKISSNALSLTIRIPERLRISVVQKGSIAIDGVSLTINEASGLDIVVTIIPETIARTSLGRLQKGNQVNIETDILVRSQKQPTDSQFVTAMS